MHITQSEWRKERETLDKEVTNMILALLYTVTVINYLTLL